ncbi:MAG: hydroxymethylglutaryl-CoA lyase [Desulfitobacteriaceae bacterium]|nr:hydroxymethylglutaryl-CoA lyase [Desulfitobacteriaceae bacterium]MDD4346206.1 hydroxymethylglutaryl-CoA lyase [Desulfitobacteriaceae bacterium]MDD4400858.1 hydroxymethylglutaryl-CoA lyase [Desulfitobacteriaceae bacterium]
METMSLPNKVVIREVGPRDGLQNEKQLLSTADKIKFIQLLVKTGLKNIEATSFVNPKAVPQMSDAGELWKLLSITSDVNFSALAFNLNGVKRAIQAGVKTVVVNVSASETMNLRHSNKTRKESLREMEEILNFAAKENTITRIDLSMVFGCPIEGKLNIDQISFMVENLLKMGIREITLADSAGLGNPRQVYEICREIRNRYPQGEFGLHIHDTKGLGMPNVLAGIQAGFEIIETSVGGLGGCPFIHNAAGNVATEDVVYMLHEMGLDTGISFPCLLDAGYYISGILGRNLVSRQSEICLGQIKG